MIHICKSQKTKMFYVVTIADNGEVLSTSELLKSKQSAIKNIRAQMELFEIKTAFYQDDTFKTSLVYSLTEFDRTHQYLMNTEPKYTPNKLKK